MKKKKKPRCKKVNIGELLYSVDYPDLDKGKIIQAIFSDVNQQVKEHCERLKYGIPGILLPKIPSTKKKTDYYKEIDIDVLMPPKEFSVSHPDSMLKEILDRYGIIGDAKVTVHSPKLTDKFVLPLQKVVMEFDFCSFYKDTFYGVDKILMSLGFLPK